MASLSRPHVTSKPGKELPLTPNGYGTLLHVASPRESTRWGITENRKSTSGRNCHPATAAAPGLLPLSHGMAPLQLLVVHSVPAISGLTFPGKFCAKSPNFMCI